MTMCPTMKSFKRKTCNVGGRGGGMLTLMHIKAIDSHKKKQLRACIQKKHVVWVTKITLMTLAGDTVYTNGVHLK